MRNIRLAQLVVCGVLGLLLCATGIDAQSNQPPGRGDRTSPPRGPEPVLIDANPDAGFHQPYFLILPEKLAPGAPVIVALPTPQTSEDPQQFVDASQRMALNAAPCLGQLGAPVLVPVIPRPPVRTPQGTINLYLPALSREALLADDPKLARIDKQVMRMIDDARARIERERNVQTSERAIFVGFSAGGHFATRMAVLHPDRVMAVWAGGTGGHPILPVAELDGKLLPYPVGVADLEELTRRPFDVESFRRIHIMIAQGSADTNTSLPSGPGPSDSYSQEHAALMREILGETALQRLSKVEEIYRRATDRASFKVYEGVEHQITPEVAADIVAFIREQLGK